MTQSSRDDLGWAEAKVHVTADFVAQVTFRAEYRRVPRHGLYLAVRGPMLQRVRVRGTRMSQMRVLSTRRGLLLVGRTASADQPLRFVASYRLSLDRLLIDGVVLGSLKREHVLAPWHNGDRDRRDTPDDTIVIVQTSVDGWRAFGPRYAEGDKRSLGVSFTCRRDHPFGVIVGPVHEESRAGGVSVVAPARSRAPSRSLARVGHLFKAARRYLEAAFGNPPVHVDAVVIGEAPTLSSWSLGSTVFANTFQRWDKGGSLSESRLLDVLAHELTHSWWSFGVVWEDQRFGHTIGEALATSLAFDAVMQILGVNASREVLKREIWPRIASLLAPQQNWVTGSSLAKGGLSAALALIHIQRVSRVALMDGVRRLWKRGRTGPLSQGDFRASLAETLGSSAADAVHDCVVNAEPVIATARVRRGRLDRWSLDVTTSRRAALRIEALGLGPRRGRRRNSTRFVFEVSDESVPEVVDSMQPWLLILKRRARQLRLAGHPTGARLWHWAERIGKVHESSIAQRTPEPQPRWKKCLAGLVCVILNSEDPGGYAILADVIRPLSRGVARWLDHFAGSRAVYHGEDNLRRLVMARSRS